eukprot:4157268-Amphidinium_carterae.1
MQQPRKNTTIRNDNRSWKRPPTVQMFFQGSEDPPEVARSAATLSNYTDARALLTEQHKLKCDG